jgi:hypothetical protein
VVLLGLGELRRNLVKHETDTLGEHQESDVTKTPLSGRAMNPSILNLSVPVHLLE